MDPILEVARKHKLVVIEDAAASSGALYKGRHAGTMGHFGSFSFYPGKNLGAWGEAGAVTTNDAALRDGVVMYREHGQKKSISMTSSVGTAVWMASKPRSLSVKLKVS